MKSALICALVCGVLLSMVSSCATVPDEPLNPGQVRLIGVMFPEIGGNIKKNVKYPVNIKFEAEGRPEITRVCIYWGVYGPTCLEVMEVNYGTGIVSAFVPTPTSGQYEFKAFVYYIRDGRSLRSNMVEIPVDVTH